MIKRFFILLLAIVASVGMSWAQDPGVVDTGTKGGMSYTFYDNGLLEISGSGALPGSAFTNWNGGFGASVKNISFAEDCEVYGLDYMWFACYTEKSQLETIEINSVTPIMFSGSSGAGITYKQDGAVTITITAPGIVDIENKIIRNYGSPVNMILNMPATTVFEKKWFSSLENYFAVTIPTGAKGHIPGGYSFTNPYDQQDYDHFVEMGHEADFWEYNGDRLTEGVDYTLGVESTFVITAENASQIFGQAAVSFQAPTQASNSEWVLWRKSDLKEFPDMSSGDQKVYKDVTVKVNNGVYNTDSGFGVHFDSSDEDGVQFVAPEGKVFKRIVILNEYGTFSDPNWSYDGNYKKWSGSANTVGFEGDICGISLIEFEVEGSAPANTPADVMALISAIGTVEFTAECKAKIDAARAAYDALSDGDKAQVTNIATLTQAETDYAALAAAAAAPVIAQIDALPTTIKLSTYYSTYDLMVAARAAYNALSAEVQAAVTNLSKLTNLEAAFAAIGGANEKLSKPFSVGEGQVVYFSHGNLQATYNGSNWSWAFAAHQYDYIGDTSGNIIINGNGTLSGAGTVDLFGWVANSSTVLTSGVAKYGVSNSDNVSDYGLGTTETLKGDWGVAANDANIGGYNDWRILSNDEWVYLFKTRTDAASKYGYATVGGVNGVIIIPDAFTDPMKNKGNLAFRPQNVDKGYSTNVYTTGGNWEAMEAAGAVFMPAAGRRYGTTMTVNEGTGFYWSSTPMSYQASYFMGFMGSNVVPNNDRYRSHGLSVRLVSNNAPVASTPLDSALVVKDLIEAIPAEITLEDACVKAINDAREAYNKLSEAAKGLLDEATIAKLTDAEAALTALYQVEADKVVAKINNIPTPVELKLATRDSIESARAAFEALNADQKALVSNIDVLTDAEATMATLNPGGGAPSTELQGDGSIENPYLIGGLEAWNAFADAVAAGVKPANAKLTNNIEGVTRMVGNFTNYYTGVFDGNGFTITMNIETNLDSAGLFRCVKEATFMNLNLEGTLNTSRKFAGSLVGAQLSINTLVIKNVCSSVAMTLSGDGDLTSGGIVGLRLGKIQITDCLFKGSMTSTGGGSMCGGIVGYSSSNLTLVRVIQAGTYNLNTSSYDGVFVRNNDANLNAQNCYYINGVGGQSTCAAATKITTDQLNTQTYVDLLQTGKEDTYWVLKDGVLVWNHHETSSPSPLDSAQAVKDLIEAIPAEITLEDACVNAIQAARDAYNALAEATKDALDAATVNKLNQAITDYTALIQAGADAVTAKIAAIPQPVTLKLATRDSINNARAAYDALTADQKALVSNYAILEAAEAALAALNPGGGMPAGALSGKFTINADGDQISFAKGNLQATTEDLGEHWTWGFAANQWNYLGIAVANNAINGNGTVSENGTVDLFGWSTAATYYGINNSYKAVDYIGDFVDWGPNMGAGWRTLTKDEWNYLIENNTKGRATVNDKNGYIFLPDNWSGPAFTPDPDNFTTNVYSGDDWTAMENAGAVFLPSGPARNGTYALIANDAKYCSSTSLNNDSSYVFTIYYNQSQSACTGTNRAYGCMVRLVTEGGGATPLDSAQAVKDLIEAIPAEITLEDVCVKAIEDARAAYDALSEATKGALDAATVQKLTDAEAAYAILIKAEADAVVAKINNIPTPVELKLATRDSIESARAAYEALNAYQKPMVTNYQTLLDAEAALAELNKGGSASVDIVWDGNTGIANVSPTTTSPAYEGMTVTVGQGSSFSTYQNRLYFTFYSQPNGGFIFANENGTNITKVVIESTTALTSTMTEVDRMGSGWVISNEDKTATWTGNADSVSIWEGQSFTNYWVVDKITFTVNGVGATPLDSAQAVKDLIDAIPTPVEYPTSGAAIEAALNAYDALSDAAKGALDAADVQKLNDAATQYAALEAIAAIEAIPAEIVYDPLVKAAIDVAREKYDALSDASKELVGTEVLDKLTNAEEAWAILVAKIEHNVSYMGKDGELKNEKVALLHIPDPAPDFNGYEFVRWDVKAGDFLEEGLRIKAIYTPIITTNPVAYDSLMYNGMAQTLITAGVAKEGHIEYRINDGEWSAELPQATFAAAYVVYYKLVREGHADYIADSIVATIAKAPVAYTAPTAAENLVYTASNQTLIAAGQTQDGTFEYSLDPTLMDSWKAELPQAKDAGTYSVYYRVQGDLNHLDSVAATPVAVTIAKEELTATADDKNVIYGDAVPAYTVTYAGWQGDDDATVLTGDLAFACEYASTSNVGEYTITPSGVDAANYTITFVNGKVTVAKAESGCIAPVVYDTLVYNGANQTLIIAGQPMGGEIQYSLDTTVLDCWSNSLPQAKDAGTYNVYYRVKGDMNHNDHYYDLITVSIAKAALTATADDKNVVYGDSVPEYTVSYSGWMGTDEASVLTGTIAFACEYAPTSNVDEYTITPSGVDAANYIITFVNGKVTVAKADLMITADDKNVIYGEVAPAFTASYSGWKNNDDESVVSGLTLTSEYLVTSNVGTYDIVPADASAMNYAISYTNGTLTVNQAALTITANDTTVIYGDEHPEFTVTYAGWKNTDDESVVSGLQFSTPYAPGSYIGTYAINPNSATALNYAITFVDGTLTVNKAHVYVSDAEAQIAKFADGHANAVVLEQGVLNGIKLNDPIAHVTTAAFSSADVAENLTITLFYELTGDAALLNNYNLDPTSDIFTTEGVIIEPFIPDNEEKPEDEEAKVDEGIEIYAYGYCDGSGYSLKYHLESGNPDQYKIDFEDSRFTDVDWTNLVITGKDGTIDIEIPVDLPTGDYTMTVYFRDSRFDWLESRQFNVTFHVNLPETYVRPLFDNVIALVDTCHCLTDIQWYWRANSSELWQPIEGANGYYYHVDGKLTGEYFVSAKMNGEPTYTCGQTDMETLYGAGQQAEAPVVRAYPNPVVNSTTVTIENSIEWIHNIRIVNLMGVEVMNDTFEGDKTSVEMGNYPQGNYMISVDGIVVKVMKK